MRWTWSRKSKPEPEPEPRKPLAIEVAAYELARREFPGQPLEATVILGLNDRRVRMFRPDGTWVLELCQGSGSQIFRVSLEPYDPPKAVEQPHLRLI